MALSENIHATAEAIVPALPGGASAEQTAARNKAVEQTEKLVTEIMKHIVANIEVKGVKVNLDSALNGIFATGVPVAMDGGAALKTAWTAEAAGTGYNKATQSNDGKGRVA